MYTFSKLFLRYCASFFAFILSLLVVMGAIKDTILLEATTASVASSLPVIVLDAGHGGEDCGAIGVNGVYEKDINFSITRGVAELLRGAGYYVLETRTDDALLYDPVTVEKGKKKNTDLYNRLQISERNTNALFVSIHMNSFPASPKQNGSQIWYSPNHPFSYEMAKLLRKYIVDDFALCNSRALMKSEGNLYLLDRASHPSVILECGFLSNPDECAKLSNEMYQNQLSFAIFCAMIEVIKLYGDQA